MILEWLKWRLSMRRMPIAISIKRTPISIILLINRGIISIKDCRGDSVSSRPANCREGRNLEGKFNIYRRRENREWLQRIWISSFWRSRWFPRRILGRIMGRVKLESTNQDYDLVSYPKEKVNTHKK